MHIPDEKQGKLAIGFLANPAARGMWQTWKT